MNSGPPIFWEDIWPKWELIEADLADKGIDVTPELLELKSARWLRVRILGLLSRESRLSRALAPKK